MKVNIGISNRHVNLTLEHANTLFGKELTKLRDLVQKGQYACNEVVTIKTAKGEIPNVRVLGPTRNYSQVEISKTDAYKLGLNPPVRTSGDLEDSEAITIVGPNGEVQLKEGCIIANRHIHMNPETAHELGFCNDQRVCVKIDTIKGGIMENVHIKVTDDGVLEMHIDTDDANAFLVEKGMMGEIIDGD